MPDARQLSGAALAAALRDSRSRLLAWTLDLSDDEWLPPPGPGVNPLAWELGHIAWFAEFFALRGPHRIDHEGRVLAERPARHAGPDDLFDSSRLPHAARWSAPLPTRKHVLRVLQAQLDATLQSLADLPDDADDGALYPYRLALFHEDMHVEAMAAMRAALVYPPPETLPAPTPGAAAGELHIEGGPTTVGWPAARPGFAFDNEAPGEQLVLGDFAIDRAPLAAGDFLRFVDDGGYQDRACWPDAAGDWLAASGRSQPQHWRRTPNGWECRWFDRWTALDPLTTLMHVNAWEAEAYCRWVGRRLPSAAEWEHAARVAGGQLEWGAVWEWTADPFRPYPGFVAGLYADYSAPWFHSHRELRGASFATPARLRNPLFRNFYLPDRADVFAGFRTVRL